MNIFNFFRRAPLVCVSLYPVTITYRCTSPHVFAHLLGEDKSSEHTHTTTQLWHRPEFSRDDILDGDALKTCVNTVVGDELRRYYREDEIRLEHANGRMIVSSPTGGPIHGYLAGFARRVTDAQCYVATGNRSALYLPWEKGAKP